ncbi:MAG: hypothetical protein QHH06_10835 [Clostridiales bacterium]|jgi:hypothetical protein|nr:hypothetical protein [Eubacteriales bacterium]MDH7566962.1 hypothetical protein [Clostridiales bacterium]
MNICLRSSRDGEKSRPITAVTIILSGWCFGSTVKMNNGETGEVIFVAPQSISTPIVYVNGKYIDLSQNKQFKIVEML